MDSLAIIICTWNRADSLRATLLSLQEQTVPNGVQPEIIVVDNNSCDGTRAAVENLTAGWRMGTLRYVFEGRQGKQFALNAGIGASSGSVLAFTDDDILFPAGWLQAICAVFSNPAIELAGGKTLLVWPPEGRPAWYADAMSAVVGGIDAGDERLAPPPRGYAPAGANLIARRCVFQRVGGFSETHFRHMDYEFGLRCARAQVAVAYEPSMVVLAPVDPDMLSKRYFRRWAFKAGISSKDEDQPGVKLLFGVPQWVVRRMLGDLFAYPRALVFGSAEQSFTIELRFWRTAGTIASRWYAYLWPASYPEWVEHYSQKKKNLY